MLSSEQARAYLESREVKNHQHQYETATKALPKALREIAFNLLGLDATGNYMTSPVSYTQDVRAQQRQQELWTAFDTLAGGDRRLIFACYFPRMAEELELTWQFMKSMPYQTGYYRKSFRAPHVPAITLRTRMNWLYQAIRQLRLYHESAEWFATYAAYVHEGYTAYNMSPLFAAVIDSGSQQGDAIYEILLASGRGEHEIGAMGRHVPRSLLLASREEGWTFIEQMLIAAQRQEGLRQSIVEVVDECHPDAFLRMLRLIIDHDLTRFSSLVRAFDVWLGYEWSAVSKGVVTKTLERLHAFLSDEAECQRALYDDDAEGTYLALWSTGYFDVEKAVPLASELLNNQMPEKRYAATHFLAQTQLSSAAEALAPVLGDEDWRIIARATDSMLYSDLASTDIFERVEAIVNRMSKQRKTLPPIIWPWNTRELDPSRIAGLLLRQLGTRDPKRLIPYLDRLEIYDRSRVAALLAAQETWDDVTRDMLLFLLKDRSRIVRDAVLKVFTQYSIQLATDEMLSLEDLLTRKSEDLRRGVIQLLAAQPVAEAVASGKRLVESGKEAQRLAGLELLALLVADSKITGEAKTIAQTYLEHYPEPEKTEKSLLQRLTGEQEKPPTLEDALGLMNADQRTSVPQLRKQEITLVTTASMQALVGLDELIHQNREKVASYAYLSGARDVLVGNMHPAHIGLPNPRADTDIHFEQVPLGRIIREWWQQRPAELRDADGLELVRMWVLLHYDQKENAAGFFKRLLGRKGDRLKLAYPSLLKQYLVWLLHEFQPARALDFLLDSIEHRLVDYRPEYVTTEQAQSVWGLNVGDIIDWRNTYRGGSELTEHVYLAHTYYLHINPIWEDAHIRRWWSLSRWIDEGLKELARHRPPLWVALEAHRVGAATDDDIYDLLLGERGDQKRGYYYYTLFSELLVLSGRTTFQHHYHSHIQAHDSFMRIYERCRDRILEVETKRGDLPTAASLPAMALRTIPGSTWFTQVLQGLGKGTLLRGYIFGTTLAKNAVMSKLLKGTYPTDADTPLVFEQAVRSAKITETRLIEATVYAPQWAHLAEHVLGWEGYADAVWWIHAHTKDNRWSVDSDVRQLWVAQMDERTPLNADDLQAGAVDVMWFKRIYEQLGEERWQTIYKAAKYASSSGGHNRARLFADTMLTQVTFDELVKRIGDKRHQDSVRALGLLQIPDDQRDDVILERYQVVQEFLRGSRKFGNQQQLSEKTAARIALENLARTAGYPDPQRLQWAMEAHEVEDLRNGSLVLTVDEVTFTLSVNSFGEPKLAVEKTHQNGKTKTLKSIPRKLKKLEEIAHLQERHKMLKQQASRMQKSLEEAMCRMDTFSVHELSDLFKHPVLRPMLVSLLFVGEVGMGYLVDEGAALENHQLQQLELPSEANLRIAHPHDLYQSGDWYLWQRHCFITERIQPFKQVFRELYLPTENEQDEPHVSMRYAGHQVQPRQAMALLGSRGWVARPEEGVQRTFHHEKITAFLTFQDGYYTPASVEDLTLGNVVFGQPGEWWKPELIKDVSPILFSEVMRDLDLVVSVAHSGGVDPEATQSTIEMRIALLKEIMVLLKIENVRIEKKHAFVDGKLGSYSVHMGSAVVHRQPGGALCIIPVHSQHRGRLFLPFADDDPRTAEVLSKVILLARDDQIKDPTILEQLIN